MDSFSEDATLILQCAERGDETAAARLLPLVYDELRRVAERQMAREGPQTLQPTALVHEAFLRLMDQTRVDWKGRGHFLSVAATMMRRILVDRARARARQRDLHKVVAVGPEDAVPAPGSSQMVDVLALDDALGRMSVLYARQARVVELRFFAGLSVEVTAQALDVSTRTVEDDWAFARGWLSREMRR